MLISRLHLAGNRPGESWWHAADARAGPERLGHRMNNSGQPSFVTFQTPGGRLPCHRKTVIAAGKRRACAINLHVHASIADGGTDPVARLTGREQLHGRALAIRDLDSLRRANIKIHDTE